MTGSLIGAEGRNRTADTAIFSRLLYRLSYLGIPHKGEPGFPRVRGGSDGI